MCNLYGVYKKKQEEMTEPNIIKDTELLKLRGRDAFGTVVVFSDGKEMKLVKDVVDLNYDFKGVKYFAFESRAIPEPELIEHIQKGLDHKRDTQPFVSDEWITSHNGTVIQPEKIIKTWELSPKSPVDSALLPELFKVCNPERALRYHIDGSYALAAYERKEHVLHLLATFQPMYYVETKQFVYYASIKDQLEYLEEPIIKVEPYTAVKFSRNTVTKESLYRNEVNNKVMVICSGGLDSVTTARLYDVLGYEVSLLHLLYSQAAESIEYSMIQRIAEYYGYPLITLDVRNVFQQAAKSSRLLQGKPAESALEDAEGTPSYVGNRNMIFASMAAGIAEENKIGRVVMGLNLSDGSGYPDNCVPYLLNMEETFKTSLNQQSRILFRSPFVNLMKHEVLQVAFAIGSPLHWQVSCYYPTMENDNPKYCKGCGSHLLRAYAFKYLGYKDPVPYADSSFNFEGCKEELPEYFWTRVFDKKLKLSLEEIPFAKQMKWSL